MVTCHRAVADGTKRTSHLGAASPKQKPARPASEVVRDPVRFSARKGREFRTRLLTREGDPSAQTLNGVVAPFQAPARLLRQLLAHEQDRRCHVSSHSLQAAFPSRSCVFDPGTRRHAFGLRVSLRHLFLRQVRCRSGSQTLQKRQRLFSYCSPFSTFCVSVHTTHFIASPRSPGIGRLPETVKHVTVSPCPFGMGLRSGLTVYF